MEKIPTPTKIEYKELKKNKTQIVVEPLFPGYGITIANPLRRVLLSSLTGAAITKIKIKGASHEFSTLKNVKEDVVELILNIKKIRLKLFSDEPIKLKLKITGEQEVKAGDINKNAEAEIANPELVLAHITDKKGELEIEFTAEKGKGYVTVEEKLETEDLTTNEISLDSLFAPIVNVSFNIEPVRVGKRTNYEKLSMKIESDGTISPKEALYNSSKIIMDHFSLIIPDLEEKKIKKKKISVKKTSSKKTTAKKIKKEKTTKSSSTKKKKTTKKK
ncbi:DNA-directed RNA polymerase subunit alpha [bacterium]|nr:DNA-directed RNA polymerase subunit alpha [bacterium]